MPRSRSRTRRQSKLTTYKGSEGTQGFKKTAKTFIGQDGEAKVVLSCYCGTSKATFEKDYEGKGSMTAFAEACRNLMLDDHAECHGWG